MNGPFRLLHARQPLQIVAFCRINAKPEQVKRLTPFLRTACLLLLLFMSQDKFLAQLCINGLALVLVKWLNYYRYIYGYAYRNSPASAEVQFLY